MTCSQIPSTDDGATGAPIGVLRDVLLDVLLIGGVDPRGGAGLVRDILTAAALGARPVAVGTAWTQQGDTVHRVEARGAAALLDAVRHEIDRRPAAVKVGMVADAEGAAAVASGLGAYAGPVIVDPVLASSRGGALFQGAPADLLGLLARATLVTPNVPEAEALCNRRVRDLAGAADAARALCDLGLGAVLIKGGHLGSAPEPVTDTLLVGTDLHRFTRTRVPGGDVRGTGCALATAMAVYLGRGLPPVAAVKAATAWLNRALAAAVDVGGERHLGDTA